MPACGLNNSAAGRPAMSCSLASVCLPTSRRCGGGVKYADAAEETAAVRLLPTGGAEVTVGTTAFGTGHATSWSQLVAGVLGVPLADVRVIHGDTASAPHGFGSYGSRSLVVGGAAVHAAALRTREKAMNLAAEMLEAAVGDLELVGGVFGVKGHAERDCHAGGGRIALLSGRRCCRARARVGLRQQP